MIHNYLIGSGVFYNKNKGGDQQLNLQAMAKDRNQIAELKKLIREELKECNSILWPKVCEMQSTEKGLEKIEELIIRNIAEEGMGIGSAIALIEQELGHQQ